MTSPFRTMLAAASNASCIVSCVRQKLKMRSGGMDGRGKKKGKFPRLKYRRRQTEGKDAAGKEQAKGEGREGRGKGEGR